MFVHGFNNTFDYAAKTLAGISHFLQRRQVPLLYSWTAGGIRGYVVDKVSGEFTIFHLKETLRTLMVIPEIDNLHIIAHSRGTDVITTALKELITENRGTNRNMKEDFGIENLVLAAPDLSN
jgi:esterase/lipase superfamily enzyme